MVAADSAARAGRNPLEEFFEVDRRADGGAPVVYGRGWKAFKLRFKPWDDLQKLWYVLLMENNMLITQHPMRHAQNLRFSNPERLPKVNKSICRTKHLLLRGRLKKQI